MDDMYKSIKAFLYDRTSSPLFGAFLLSWLLVNFKVVLTVFSSEDLPVKFHTIDILFSNIPFLEEHILWLGIIIHSFFLPTIVTLSYIYLYPLLAKPVYEHSLKKQMELRKVKQEEEGNRLLTIEESQEIYRQMAELENKYNQQEEKHRKQLAGLISKKPEVEGKGASEIPSWVRHLSEEKKIDYSKVADRVRRGMEDELTQEQNNVLKALKGTTETNRKEIHDILDPFEGKPFDNADKLKSEADELVNKGLLGISFDNQYFLTHKGRGYLIKSLSDEI